MQKWHSSITTGTAPAEKNVPALSAKGLPDSKTRPMSQQNGRSAVDHTESNAPDPFRTPKLSDSRPGQYWAGGLPGNSKELAAFSVFTGRCYCR